MEYSESDTQYASKIIARLLSRDGEKLDLELENNLVISDLESDSNRFTTELDLAEGLNMGFPTVRIGGDNGFLTPISLFSIIGYPFWNNGYLGTSLMNIKNHRKWWHKNPYIYEWYSMIRDWKHNIETDNQLAGLSWVSPDKAREAFTGRASVFLATRIAAVRKFRDGESKEREKWERPATLNLAQSFGGPKVTTPGCYFSVSTNSIGLRVFWSGAYFIASNYFSHPSSPVTSLLQAGTYIFGVDGGVYGNTIQWDANAVTSLPGSPFVHLNY